MLKEKGTNTSDVICGKCLVPQAGPVRSRDLLPWPRAVGGGLGGAPCG